MVDEKLPENATARGEQIMKRLQKFAESTPLIGEVRGKGLMIGVELVKDKQKTPPQPKQKKCAGSAAKLACW